MRYELNKTPFDEIPKYSSLPHLKVLEHKNITYEIDVKINVPITHLEKILLVRLFSSSHHGKPVVLEIFPPKTPYIRLDQPILCFGVVYVFNNTSFLL